MKRTYDLLIDFCGWMAGSMIVFCASAVALDVLLRSFGQPLTWVFETTELLLLYITMLSLPWLARRRGHIAVDIVVGSLSRAHAAWLEVCTNLIVVMVCLVIAYWGALSTFDAYARGLINAGLTPYPLWVSRIVIPFGFGLAAVEFLRLLFRAVRCRSIK